MTYPHVDILSADSTANRAVLLSERTQLILLKVLQSGENQSAWDETTDSEWDDLDESIGEAEYEILTEIEPVTYNPILLIATREAATQSLLAANSPNEIVWDTGYFDVSNPTRIVAPDTAIYSISFNFRVTTAVATAWTISLVKNGSAEIARLSPVSGTAVTAALSINVNLFENDYLEVAIAHSTNSTLQITTPGCYFGMIRFME